MEKLAQLFLAITIIILIVELVIIMKKLSSDFVKIASLSTLSLLGCFFIIDTLFPQVASLHKILLMIATTGGTIALPPAIKQQEEWLSPFSLIGSVIALSSLLTYIFLC